MEEVKNNKSEGFDRWLSFYIRATILLLIVLIPVTCGIVFLGLFISTYLVHNDLAVVFVWAFIIFYFITYGVGIFSIKKLSQKKFIAIALTKDFLTLFSIFIGLFSCLFVWRILTAATVARSLS